MVTTRYNHAESNPKSYERNSIMWDEYSQVTAGATRVDQVIARPNVSEFPLGTFGDMTVGDQVFIWSPRSNRDRISDASVKSGIYKLPKYRPPNDPRDSRAPLVSHWCQTRRSFPHAAKNSRRKPRCRGLSLSTMAFITLVDKWERMISKESLACTKLGRLKEGLMSPLRTICRWPRTFPPQLAHPGTYTTRGERWRS